MIQGQRVDPPHGILFAVVVVLLIGIPMFLGDGGEALAEFIAELLTPLGMLLLPIVLLLIIQFLSSGSGSFISAGEPNSIHRASGSPAGVALVLVLVLLLLYSKVSMFGGDEDSEE